MKTSKNWKKRKIIGKIFGEHERIRKHLAKEKQKLLELADKIKLKFICVKKNVQDKLPDIIIIYVMSDLHTVVKETKHHLDFLNFEKTKHKQNILLCSYWVD